MTESRIEVEELPVGPRAQELINEVASTQYRSRLKQFGGIPLHQELRQGKITLGEYNIIAGEREARRQILTAPADQLPPEIPETTAASTSEWSPTDILKTIPDRELDARERAAGEHLTRS